jgi:hypothetical protein
VMYFRRNGPLPVFLVLFFCCFGKNIVWEAVRNISLRCT